ncbi:MAG: hypothetical protein ACR2H3_07950 [Acidimicrobiales bacterium]
MRPDIETATSGPREVVEGFSPRLRSLVGYDLHPPFIGNVDGRNPAKLLG